MMMVMMQAACGLRLLQVAGQLGLGEITCCALVEAGELSVRLGGRAAQFLDIGFQFRLGDRAIAIAVNGGEEF